MNERGSLCDLIDELRRYPKEKEWFDFKVNNSESHMIGEYISALSNAALLHQVKHGYLVFGIDDVTHEILGTTFTPQTEKGRGNEDLEPWLKRLLDPRVDFSFHEITCEEKPVVIVQIDAAYERPVRFDGTEYIRVGSYKTKLSNHPELERKLWALTHSVRFEEGYASSGITGDDVLDLLDYPAFFHLLEVPLPESKSGILKRLEDEQAISRDEAGFKITNLGALLFARDLGNFSSLRRKTLRIIIYDGKGRTHAKKEHSPRGGYAITFESAIDWICDQLPSNEVIDGALRVEERMYPKVAIREFVANALIHQDFSISGTGPMVEIFDDRMEISNPGKPLIDPERFIDHPPRSRNETLASMMRRMNICEERGSGVDRAIGCIEVYQLPAPDIQEDEDFTRVTLFAHQSYSEMGREDKVRACYQHACLLYVCREFMTNATLRKRLGIDDQNYPIASRIIGDTMKAGLIRLHDPETRSNRSR
ncbi:MAG TPA: ATP-binding protein, partial [Bacillota bacterium]|nr:ATP-binding protein [Bacillota bacterium]HPZ14865.1 ATP-binding protein [Bacillota bacterium]